MQTREIVMVAILFLLAAASLAVSFFQWKEKGILMNNAYLYASEEERRRMDKKPHYKQSGMVFLLVGLTLSAYAVELILETGWLFLVMLFLLIFTLSYAIISSIKIEKKNAK